jgi:hypothetical protein
LRFWWVWVPARFGMVSGLHRGCTDYERSVNTELRSESF